jgi:hypothetical protein
MRIYDVDESDRELFRQFIALPIPKLPSSILQVLYGEIENDREE